MTRWLVSFILQGIILPLSLFVAIAMRQSGTSGLYLLLLFASPLVPVPTSKSMSGASGFYQKIVIITATLNMLAMMAFQIVLACYQPYGSILDKFCSETETILRYSGFVRLDELHWLSVFLWVFPDFAVSLTALFVHTVCVKLNPPVTDEQLLPIAEQAPSEPEPAEGDAIKKQRKLGVLVSLGKYVTIMSLFFAGAIRPSGLNSIYFLTFLIFMTWWAFNKNLGIPFAYILRIISGFVAGHIVVIFVYQLMWVQDKLPDRQPLARYLGLRALFNSTCIDPRRVEVTDYEADTFINPLLLVWLYFILCHESSLIINVPVVDFKDAGMTRQLSTRLSQRGRLLRNQTNRWRSATRKVRLIRGRESMYRRTSARRGLVQDAMGSVTITEVDEDSPKVPGSPNAADGPGRLQGDVESIELDDLTDKENNYNQKDSGGIVDIALNACIAIFQFIAQTSYIATNIIMMTWSITYHSWITFVLLLWASAMWLVPNQRKAMLRSSPFLVFYAILLLLAQYIYGMDLTEDELPEDIQGYNLKQIGFSRTKHFPLKPLLFKTLFTMMFWITLKQYNQEKWEARNRSALEDIAAPLQIGVGTAAGLSGDPNAATSNLIRKIGQFTRSVLTKFWIWVVACILFTIGIVGDRMTIFKIIYMAMALLFILTFQLSWTLWRKIMYGFWLVVIIFSMFILICTYTYQFDNFDKYWANYLHLNVQLQQDMGLEKYETTELFVKLLTPTFFVVITVIQLYYFHDDFLAISDIKSRNTSISGAPGRGRNSDSLAPSSKASVSHSTQSNLYAQFWAAIDFVWLFLEIHLMKLVILSLALLAIYNVCAAHFGFLLLSVVAALFGSNIQTLIAHICSCLISLLIILKMIYQINYIEHNAWNVTCKEQVMAVDADGEERSRSIDDVGRYLFDRVYLREVWEPSNETYNTAVWIGFEKVDEYNSLPSLLRGYIGVLIVITLHAVVVRRQKFHRVQKGRPPNRPDVMFPRVTYKDIDRDTLFFIKYLLNYGFYRFGVEISLIGIVGLIGLRMDFYATLYALWLFLIISPVRPKLSKIWPLLTVFIVITIPIQYFIAVGLPPNLCIEMPWNRSQTWIRLRDWMFLPDSKSPPPVHRLLYDFLVLMFVARQGFMFRLEKRNRNVDFPGGDNSSVVRQIERVGVNNPVPDFISTTRSFLDVIKRVVLTSFYWISLAIFFLAGTNRVNIFSLGYLIGAFVFLWHGNDFYLRPIKSILKWWHYLIIYNVHVIVIKTLLQILGCIFIDFLKHNFCWAVQLLGIACVYKVQTIDPQPTPSPIDPQQHECTVPKDDVSLTWDFFCFMFLILQRRLFSSFYFYRIINEAKAMAILASRGAELIEELSDRQVQAQMESENRLLEKIKNKMDRIKASQKKIQQKEGREYKEPGDHFSENVDEVDKPVRARRKCSRKWAIRSGDYYMFEDYEDDLDLISEKSGDSGLTAYSDEQVDVRRTSVSQLISNAMKSDLKQATNKAKANYEESKVIARKQPGDEEQERVKSEVFQRDRILKGLGADSTKTSPQESPSTTPPLPPPDGSLSPPLPPPDGDKQSHPKATSSKTSSESAPLSAKDKIIVFVKFVYEFINSIMVSLTRRLNKTSRDYRYVMKALTAEKKKLLSSPNFGVGTRPGRSRVWRPHPKMLASRRDESDIPIDVEATPSTSEKRRDDVIKADDDFGDDDIMDMRTQSPAVSFGQFEEGELRASDQPPIIRLIIAIWFAILSHSDLVCYFIIFLHQIYNPTLLSLPLPLMVFLWGTLTVPRPSKRFWVTIIAYTEVVVVIKCMFQLEMLPWNRKVIPENNPFAPPRIIGVERQPGTYAYFDLILLLVVFFHRAMLKSLGLWKMIPTEGSRRTSISGGSRKPPAGSSTMLDSVGKDRDESDSHKRAAIEQPGHCPAFLDLERSKLNKYACFHPMLKFFTKLLRSKGRVTTDVYAFMFFCDFSNFIVVIFGFAAFGSNQGDGGVSQYFEENKVPVAFLIMLILQFILIIVDRTLYLRKYIFGKLVFQYILVVGIHIWMFFVLPAVTQRQFNAATPPQLWYTIKCFYLLLSAYQIRCGYPSRIYGNFLCKGYNYINYYLFKVFMAVPFVFELRALMDWIWTDTSMTLSDWLKMEDIFAHVYQLKCQRRAEREYPQERGVKKASVTKYIVGGGCLVGIICVIWFPLVLFALGNTVGKANLPTDVTVSVRIGAFAPIYQYTAQNDSILRLTHTEWDSIMAKYSNSRSATTFLSNYLFDDVGVVALSRHSTAVWTISPPDNTTFISDLMKDKPIPIRLDWTINRQTSSPEHPPTISDSQADFIEAGDPNRKILVDYLKNDVKNDSSRVGFPALFPKFLKITNRGSATPVQTLMNFNDEIPRDLSVFRGVLGALHQTDRSMWWDLTENCTFDAANSILSEFPYMKSCDDKLIMYTFSDKAFPSSLSIISGKGIIGLYTTFVIVIHSLIRGFFTGISFKIMFDDMPNVDRLLQLCLDIYLVRESRELDLEEDLFAKLVFLYRSPETLIKWTRPPEEIGEDEVDEQPELD